MNILLYVSVLALSAALLAAAPSVDDTSQLEVIAVGVFLQVGQNRNIDLITPCIANIARAKVSVHTMTATPLQLDIHVSYVFGFSAQEQAKLDDFLRSLAGVDSVHSATHVNRGFDVAPFLSQLQRTVAAQLSYDLIFKIHTKSNRQWLQHTTQCMCGSVEHVMSILRQFTSSPQIGMLAPRGTALGSRSERIKVAPFLLRQLFSEQELWLAFQDSIIRDMTEIWRLIFRDGGSISREDAVVVAGTMFWARLSALQPEQLARALPLLQPSMSVAYRRDGAVEHLLERLFGTMVEIFGYTVREMGPAPEIILTLPQGSMCLNNATQRVLHSSIHGVSLSYKLHRSEYVQQHRELVSCATSGIRFMVRVDCSRGLGEDTHWRNQFNFISTLLQHRNYITCNGNPVLILELPRQDADRGAMTRLLAVWQDEACFKGLRVGLHVLQHRTSYSSSSSLLRLVTASADLHVASFFMISHYLPWGGGKCGQGRDGGTFSSYDGGGRSKRKTTNDAGVAVGGTVYLLVDSWRGQQAKILSSGCSSGEIRKNRKHYNTNIKVRLMRYVGMPVLCVSERDVTASPPATWPMHHEGLNVSYNVDHQLSQFRNDSGMMLGHYWGLHIPPILYTVPVTDSDKESVLLAKRRFTEGLVTALTCDDNRIQDGGSKAYFFLSQPLPREIDFTETSTDLVIDVVDSALRRLPSCSRP